MRCPFCGRLESRVIDSRLVKNGWSIRRRRQCSSCDKRYTTYEKVESIPYRVVKKDGSREPYVREKIMQGLLKACQKRPIRTEQLENIIEEIETKLFSRSSREIASDEIGAIILERLNGFDDVAYLRFASVYQRFEGIEHFEKELRKLKKKMRSGERDSDQVKRFDR